jgi:Protein of unknown function (DUF2637)
MGSANGDPMNQPLSPAPRQPAPLQPVQPAPWQRRLVNLLVALVVIAVAAAMFIFSYSGVHAIAELGGVSAQLARYYPGLFDAVLVIACVAAIMLRDGRWWARLWAWLVIIVVLAAIGTTDVLHAMNYTLRHRPTEGIVAAAPVVAVLLAFSLLLTMLRQSKAHAAQPAGPAPLDVPALPAALPVIALPAAPESPADSEEPVEAIAPAAPASEATASEAHASEAPASEAPASEALAAQDEPAPPTVQVPTLTSPPPPGAASRRVPQGIRYAGNGVPGMAGKSAGKPPTAERDASPDAEYWESEEAGQFAGLVYPAREDEDKADLDDAAPAKNHPELNDDAPPFATAPFAAVPRLNRVRSMPTPPADEDEDE